MNNIHYLTLFALLLLPSTALAKPTAEEVQSVLNHYNSGSEVILVDYQFCSAIAREGENKNECVDSLDPATLKRGDKVYLWMNYMVPKSTTPSIRLQFLNAGRVGKSRDISLTGSFRYRTWSLALTSTAGDWKITIDQQTGAAFTSIALLDYHVGDKTE